MNFLLLILVMLAVAVTQILAGGRQMVLCMPGYALITLAAVLSWWPARRTPIPRALAECAWAAVVFFAYIVVRGFFSPEVYLARNDIFQALVAMAVYLVVALSPASSRMRLLFPAGLLLLGAANCAVGSVQFFKGQNFMLFDFLPRTDYGSRASGFYGYPNHLAGFLEIAGLMGLGAAFWSRWPSWAKMVAGYVSLLCLLSILSTGSRGGYISVTVGLLVFGLLSLVLIGKLASSRAVGFILAGIVFVGGIGWGVQHVMAKSFLVHERTGATLTVDPSRVRMWQAAWEQSRLHPLVGTGSGTYLYYGRQFRNPTIQADPMHAHDDYFELLAEYGILGIIAMVIFLETHLRHGWQAFIDMISGREDAPDIASDSLALIVGSLSATAACLVQSLLDFNLHIPANVFVVAFVFGLLANPGVNAEPDARPESDLPSWLRLALPALGIWIAVGVLPFAPAEYWFERANILLSDWHFLTAPKFPGEVADFAQRGLAWDAHNPELYASLGDAQLALADFAVNPVAKQALNTQALAAFEAARNLAPGNVWRVVELASALDTLRRYPDSDPLFARALTMDPKSSAVLNAYASHLRLEGKLAEADAQYRLALQLGGGPASELGLEMTAEDEKAKAADGSTPKP